MQPGEQPSATLMPRNERGVQAGGDEEVLANQSRLRSEHDRNGTCFGGRRHQVVLLT